MCFWQECEFVQPLWNRVWRFLKNLGSSLVAQCLRLGAFADVGLGLTSGLGMEIPQQAEKTMSKKKKRKEKKREKKRKGQVFSLVSQWPNA